MDLVYRSTLGPDGWLTDLKLNECTIRSTAGPGCAYWQLWAWVTGEVGERLGFVAVPVLVGGQYTEQGPSGRRTWGLTRVSDGVWQISPSIDVRTHVDAVGKECAKDAPGAREVSWWHQTPRVVGVADGERWTREAP
jgi:hypothetical protein